MKIQHDEGRGIKTQNVCYIGTTCFAEKTLFHYLVFFFAFSRRILLHPRKFIMKLKHFQSCVRCDAELWLMHCSKWYRFVMPERITSLRMPKLIGRLNQVQYIPVYDVNKGKQKRRSDAAPDWFDYLVRNHDELPCLFLACFKLFLATKELRCTCGLGLNKSWSETVRLV